jgi:hypothetical protein
LAENRGEPLELGQRVRRLPTPGGEAVVLAHQPVAAEATVQHHQGGADADRHARIGPAGCEVVGPRRQILLQSGRLPERRGQERCRGALDRRMRTVEHGHAERGEEFRQRVPVAPRHGCLGPEVPGEPGEGLLAELRCGEIAPQCRKPVQHRGSERFAVHRGERCFRRPRGKARPGHRSVGPDPPCVVGFREVVIVARAPEHRDHRTRPALLENRRERRRRKRLVHRVQRPGEQRRLLSRGQHQHVRSPQPLAQRFVARRDRERRQQCRFDTARALGRGGQRCTQRRRYDLERHGARPTRMARGAPGPSGVPL